MRRYAYGIQSKHPAHYAEPGDRCTACGLPILGMIEVEDAWHPTCRTCARVLRLAQQLHAPLTQEAS